VTVSLTVVHIRAAIPYPAPMATQPRAILLDMDGTLVDSFPGITAALNRALGDAGLPPVGASRLGRMGRVSGAVTPRARGVVSGARCAGGCGLPVRPTGFSL